MSRRSPSNIAGVWPEAAAARSTLAASLLRVVAHRMRPGRASVPVACSWSGGKDSALALTRAVERGAVPTVLLSVLDELGERSRSHGLRRSLLAAQADGLGIRFETASSSWSDYTDSYRTLLSQVAGEGIDACVFGDIDTDAHRQWCEGVCAPCGLRSLHPLWQRPRRELLEELWTRGFRMTVVVVRAGVLDRELLGCELDSALVDEIERQGVDACGENGEYHTVVTDGPLFASPIRLEHGEIVLRSGCWALDVSHTAVAS